MPSTVYIRNISLDKLRMWQINHLKDYNEFSFQFLKEFLLFNERPASGSFPSNLFSWLLCQATCELLDLESVYCPTFLQGSKEHLVIPRLGKPLPNKWYKHLDAQDPMKNKSHPSLESVLSMFYSKKQAKSLSICKSYVNIRLLVLFLLKRSKDNSHAVLWCKRFLPLREDEVSLWLRKRHLCSWGLSIITDATDMGLCSWHQKSER
jgi:hypothetical protein